LATAKLKCGVNIIGSGFFVVSIVWWIQQPQYLEIIDIPHTERKYTMREP